MTLKELAKKIPESYRREILQLNMINNAVTVSSDSNMDYLFTIWKNFIEPDGSLSKDCGLCLERIRNNYVQMQPIFIELEREAQLLLQIP